jgi:hypothetical protein
MLLLLLVFGCRRRRVPTMLSAAAMLLLGLQFNIACWGHGELAPRRTCMHTLRVKDRRDMPIICTDSDPFSQRSTTFFISSLRQVIGNRVADGRHSFDGEMRQSVTGGEFNIAVKV